MPPPPDYAIAQQLAKEICRRVGAPLTPFPPNLSLPRPPPAPPPTPSPTPAGIYRSLDFLTELGSSYRVSKSFIACAMPDHAHPSQMLVCRRCGTVVETEDSRVARATESLGMLLHQSTANRCSTIAA